jgi:hypothetical protein
MAILPAVRVHARKSAIFSGGRSFYMEARGAAAAEAGFLSGLYNIQGKWRPAVVPAQSETPKVAGCGTQAAHKKRSI